MVVISLVDGYIMPQERTKLRTTAVTQLIKEGVQAGEIRCTDKPQTTFPYDSKVPKIILPIIDHGTVVDIDDAVRYLKGRGMDFEFFKYRDDS